MMKVLVAGASTRAIAESAARAGFPVAALDAFGDLDQHPSVRAWSVPRDFARRPTAHAIVAAAESLDADAVVYLSPFENHPRLVTALARGRALWGNPERVLRRARDPFLLMQVLRDRGFTAPMNIPGTPNLPNHPNDLLLKPRSSGGGRRVRDWRSGRRVPSGCYLQERIRGVPGSVVFVAAAGEARALGVSRQLAGDAAFGVGGYRYCGSILTGGGAPGHDRGLMERAVSLAQAVAAGFDLVGVNGVDFIAREGVPVPIEINPRWSSSMELVERSAGFSVFAAHAAACTSGRLPLRDLLDGPGFAIGKAIVYAREDVIVGDTRAWLDDADVRDVPHPGERIAAGGPVCTVFAAAADEPDCYAALADRAARVYHQLSRRGSRSVDAAL